MIPQPFETEAPCVWVAEEATRIDPDSARAEAVCAASRFQAPSNQFALIGETVAWQIAVRAGAVDLSQFSVRLEGPSLEELGRATLFVEVPVPLRSRTRATRGDETIGWSSTASRPRDEAVPAAVFDPLVPIEHAGRFAPYPMRVPARSVAAVWIDLRVGDDAPPGRHVLTLVASEKERDVARVDVNLFVKRARLPTSSNKVVVYYDPSELTGRIGQGDSERSLWRELRAHHVSPLLSADDLADIERLRPALDGTAAAAEDQTKAPVPEPVILAFGAYGSLGDPTPRVLEQLASMLDALGRIRTPESRLALPALEAFVYAVDEQCGSPRAARFRRMLGASADPRLERLPVGETCGEHIATRASDLIMTTTGEYRTSDRLAASARGKHVWVYNGQRPFAGSLVLDAPTTDLRANGWIQAMFGIEGWFYWESTFWNDDNRGGRGPVDPFEITENFHNAHGDAALGDGLLVYPGTQVAYPAHSLGMDGVLPSIRLKSLRRGVQDAGYLALASRREPKAASQIARALIPRALDEVRPTDPCSWPSEEGSFQSAKRRLWELVAEEPSSMARSAAASEYSGAAPAAAASSTPTTALGRGVSGTSQGFVYAVFAALLAGVYAIVYGHRRARRSTMGPGSSAGPRAT